VSKTKRAILLTIILLGLALIQIYSGMNLMHKIFLPDAMGKIAKNTDGSINDFAAKGDGMTDDTAAIQNMISGGGTIVFDGGNYLVGPLFVESNSKLIFAQGAKLTARPNYEVNDRVLTLNDVENVEITGLRIEMPGQDYAPGSNRHAIRMNGATNITITNATISGTGGDGIYIGGYKTNKSFCENVLIKGVVIDSAKRNGISIVSGKNILIEESVISNVNGDRAPGAGIDIEPNGNLDTIEKIIIKNLNTYKCYGKGISIVLKGMQNANKEVSIMVNGHIDEGSNGGLSISGVQSMYQGYIRLQNLRYINNYRTGLYIKNKASDAIPVLIENVYIQDSNVKHSDVFYLSSGISIHSLSNDKGDFNSGGILMRGIEILDTHRPARMSCGIHIHDQRAGRTVKNVSIVDVVRLDKMRIYDLYISGQEINVSDDGKMVRQNMNVVFP